MPTAVDLLLFIGVRSYDRVLGDEQGRWLDLVGVGDLPPDIDVLGLLGDEVLFGDEVV